MTTKLINVPSYVHDRRLAHGFFDDFDSFNTADMWTVVADTGGAQACTDAANGILSIATDGDDNDEAYITSTNEIFLVAAGKPVYIEARLQFTEAATDDANVIFGVAQEAGANILVDNGAGLATTMDGAAFYKVDGGTRWQVGSSNATSQTTSDTGSTAGGASYQTLAIAIQPVTSVDAEVYFWIDESGGSDLIACRTNGANPRTPSIKHNLTITGLLEMHVVCGAKAGGANAETVLVDYITAWQKR